MHFIKQYFIPDGQWGVDLFFVLSGYLITSILLNARIAINGISRLHVIRNFFLRRALRIFPIYYLMILFLLIISYKGIREHVWYYLTYTSNILFFTEKKWGAMPHTWSLAVEEQFYLVWPCVILFVKDKYLKYAFIVAITTGIISSYITSVLLGKENFPILIYNCIGCFGLGGFYAYARLNEETRIYFERIFYRIFWICVLVYFTWKAAIGPFWAHTNFLFRMVDGVIALQLIIAVINNKSAWFKKYLLENRILNFVGRISYGLYLYHFALQEIYDGYIGRHHSKMPPIFNDYYFSYGVKLLLLFLLSWISYVLVEQPLLRLKKRFEYE